MDQQPCEIRTQLRPLGRPAMSFLLKPLAHTRRASLLAHKYFIRSLILTIFSVNLGLYIMHAVSHEVICTIAFIFYQSYFRPEEKLQSEDQKQENSRLPDGTERKRKITRVLGVDFAPADTPMRQRVQTFCVALCSFSFLFAGAFFSALSVYLLFTRFCWLPILYALWYIYDHGTHERGGHRIHWYRRWKLWTRVAEYFPIELVKTAELPPERNYIFGYHPHGIMASGSFINFATEATGFSKLFPGIVPHLMTLSMNFCFPFHRDLILGLGVVSVTRKSLNWILQRKGLGNAAVIVVGGAQEALDAHRNTNVALTLTSRKGFIRLALQNGADLVPVFSFGENDVFQQAANPPGSKLREIQDRMKKVLGFSVPLFHGRGLLQYTWGYVPYRARLTTVVGAPIRVQKIEEPSREQVDALHAQYVHALKQLFENHKHRAGCPNQTLTIY
ncbi:2-acylglycerol O-acyltransferase 2 [Galendromus occidentalis]|uniref:Acyltransferase n=1 Tax=Galendromus occidentalis TaxID=34638 RepID=A0AAJ7SGN4_9ACAR|nr:2-acylglycerol O-acyltransferase 2 [Galendromus occidentalis]